MGDRAEPRGELSEQIELLAQPGPFRGGMRVSGWLHGLSEGARTAMRDLADFVRDYNEAGLRPFWGTIRASDALVVDREQAGCPRSLRHTRR